MPKTLVLIVWLVSSAASVGIALWWEATGLHTLTGDEPHYLVIADSVGRDLDLDVANNYREVADGQHGLPRVDPHFIGGTSHSGHAPGLGILLAVPFRLGGVAAVRVALALFGALVAVIAFVWLRTFLAPAASAWWSIGLAMGLPLLAVSGQVYPDLPAGVIVGGAVVALALWNRGEPQTVTRWVVFSLAVGCLPWLHVKLLAPAVLLIVASLWLGGSAVSGNQRARRAILLIGPALIVLAALATYHLLVFGHPLGGRSASAELTFAPRRLLMTVLGLHLDQAQGMFLAQPLLAIGLAGLGLMVARDRKLALVWAAVYLAALAPNAAQVVTYGGWSPQGRFGWTSTWMWIVPLGLFLSSLDATARRRAGWLVAVALAFQAWLAPVWLESPSRLFTSIGDSLWTRNSLFDGQLRVALPSFYDVGHVLDSVPNRLFTAAAVLLTLSGAALAGWIARHSVRRLWVAFAALVAVLYPPQVPAWESPAGTREREAKLLARAESLVVRRFEGEALASPLSRRVTWSEQPDASGGAARTSSPCGEDGLVTFGPYVSLPPGRYRAVVAIRPAGPDPVSLDILVTAEASKRELLRRRVSNSEFVERAQYTMFILEFASAEEMPEVEFKVFALEGARVLVDYVDLVPLEVALDRGEFRAPVGR